HHGERGGAHGEERERERQQRGAHGRCPVVKAGFYERSERERRAGLRDDAEGRRHFVDASSLAPSASVTSFAPFSTAWPASTWTATTVPARSARTSFSIFIASSTSNGWWSAMTAPAATRIS